MNKRMTSEEVKALKGFLLSKLPFSSSQPVLVIGDMGLDEYLWGDVKRISPEAPVPVLEVRKKEYRIGLSAFVAENIKSLGGKAVLLSVVGEDESAKILRKKLNEANISTEGLIADLSRPTTRKTRVMCGGHHIVRMDCEAKAYLSKAVEDRLFESFQSELGGCGITVIEDYGKGVLSENLIQKIIKHCRQENKIVLVDPHPTTPWKFYKGAHIFTPNKQEALQLSGFLDNDLYEEDTGKVAFELIKKWDCESLVITQGKRGMVLYTPNEVGIDIPAYAREVFDVTGAGDAVIAAIALGLSAGLSLKEACLLANFAGGVVVGKVGCQPCYVEDVRSYMESV